MEKKIKFSDKGAVQKIVYLTVIAILCVSAIVIGIVASNNRKTTDTENPDNVGEAPGTDGGDIAGTPDQTPDEKPDETPGNTPPKLAFVSPAVGTVKKSHSATVPVFSETLDEWRIHTGIDISTDEAAAVVAAADGTVSAMYDDPLLGRTVEITHTQNIKTVYSNLTVDDAAFVKVGDTVKRGDRIGTVGDTSISELAEEPHLHFEVKLADEAVNPLDYMTEETKKDSLGISEA